MNNQEEEDGWLVVGWVVFADPYSSFPVLAHPLLSSLIGEMSPFLGGPMWLLSCLDAEMTALNCIFQWFDNSKFIFFFFLWYLSKSLNYLSNYMTKTNIQKELILIAVI